ncbi:MAG: H-X9-DG-CTERM domain-containing protein [Isosphaeraceae bacterium]
MNDKNCASRHPGVVNFAFMDGSVRAIKNTVSLPVFQAVSTRSEAEVVSSGSY